MVYKNRYAVPTGEQLKVMVLDKFNVTTHSEIKISIYVTIYLFRSFLKICRSFCRIMNVIYRLF